MTEFTLSWLDIGAIVAIISAGAAGMSKYMNAKLADIHNRILDERQRVNALETAHADKLERIVKLETTISGLKDTMTEVKTTVKEQNAKLDQLLIAVTKK